MAYTPNDGEMETGAPKKADVLIRSTQSIAAKQAELSEQTKLAVERIDEAIELFTNSTKDSTYITQHGAQMFEELQNENSALKQELLYIAKQSENIYAGLADKLNEIAEQTKDQTVDMSALDDLADRIAEIAEQNERNERAFQSLERKLADLSDRMEYLSQARPAERSEVTNDDIMNKLTYLSEQIRRNDNAHSMLADKIEILSMRIEQYGYESAKSATAQYKQPVQQVPVAMPAVVPVPATVKEEIDYDKIASKIAEILPKQLEEILPKQLEEILPKQLAEALPEQEGLSADYIAEKVADIISAKDTKDAISPDYIASKVAEQIVLPEVGGDVVLDTEKLARDVADMIEAREVQPVPAPVEIDGDALADKIAQRLNLSAVSEIAPVATVDIDEESLAERIAQKVGTINVDAVPFNAELELDEESLADRIAKKVSELSSDDSPLSAELELDEEGLADRIAKKVSELSVAAVPAVASLSIDEQELADSIALRVGSLKTDDFEILVDDDGCASISREIAQKLDYHAIADIVADKLREILDINAANAPDYEDMAERISEKITVAGINEDAIADKAAAVLSNYLPEFDTDEIADKVTGAVIDVVSAMPQPTVDTDAIINGITEKFAELQDDRDYDIVIDDDGIDRITALVTEEIENKTGARFDKVEEGISKLEELLTPAEEEVVEEVVEEPVEEVEETEVVEEVAKSDITEEGLDSISERVASELERGVTPRFDKMEEDIARIYEIVSNIVVEEEVEEQPEQVSETAEYVAQADYSELSDIVAAEIEKGVSSRLDSVEEKITTLTEILTPVEEDVDDATEEDTAEDAAELDTLDGDGDAADVLAAEDVSDESYAKLSEMLSTRFDAVDERLASLTELLTAEDEDVEGEEEYAEESEENEEYEEVAEEDVSLSDIATHLASVEEKIVSLTDLITGADEEYAEDEEEYEEQDDYAVLSDLVATEVEKGVSARFDSLENNLAKISALIGGIAVAGVVHEATEKGGVQDTSLLEKCLTVRFDKVDEDIAKISEYVTGEMPVVTNERIDKIAGEVAKIAQLVDGELTVETHAKLDKIQEELTALSEQLASGVQVSDGVNFEGVESGINEIKEMLAGGMIVAAATEAAATAVVEEQPAPVPVPAPAPAPVEVKPVEEEEEALVTVSDLVKGEDIGEASDDDEGDFLLGGIDLDNFSDDEAMPGEYSDIDGVDFANMMKYNRSFISRIIQSSDETKQYYGELKHALLCYKKVNSNVAWGNERFNKGRETIARMKIRGKTLVMYLALDPNEYKTSVYHHSDVSDNKSVAGTPMMIKVKSPLGVRKAIRLIDEMLEKRNGEKRELPERNYAAMYPYETIEELIEDGLVKDVRK